MEQLQVPPVGNASAHAFSWAFSGTHGRDGAQPCASFHKGKERRDRVEINPEPDRCQPNPVVLNTV